MRKKIFLAALFLIVAGLQTAWGQGFRVYKSDGTVAQFSMRTDSIVFYDGIDTDVDFGPCTITCAATEGSGVTAECKVYVVIDNSGTFNGRDYVDLACRASRFGQHATWAPPSTLGCSVTKACSLCAEQTAKTDLT